MFARSSLVVLVALAASQAFGQTPTAVPAAPPRFEAGRPVGVTLEGAYTAASPNLKVYGAISNAESCSYDRERRLIVVPSRGANQNEIPNDAYVSLINHDGTVHTIRWIGVNRQGLVLNHPLGSDIHGGKLYLADRDGGTADGAPSISVLRMFDMRTGAPAGEVRTPDSSGFNDIAVAADGTVYASQSGGGDANAPMRIYRIAPDGRSTVFIDGAPLNGPNGVAIDNDGNIVVLNANTDEILTFSTSARLMKTERAAMTGNDGIVIMPDGAKYTSSVRRGGISRIRPGQPAELIAQGLPSGASMCYDSDARQLVIPMNANNGLAFLKIE